MKTWPFAPALLISVVRGPPACLEGVRRRSGAAPPRHRSRGSAWTHVGTDHVPPSLDTLVTRLAELGWLDFSRMRRCASSSATARRMPRAR